MTASASKANYRNWTSEELVTRIQALEAQLTSLEHRTASSSPKRFQRRSKAPNIFDPSRYSTRFIALKFAYLGQKYNGLEHHLNNVTPLPTIEEEIWKALVKTKLIYKDEDGEVDWDGCEYSKCGRTDKGVSAFGQVIGIRVRSNRPVKKTTKEDIERKSDGVETAKSDDADELMQESSEMPMMTEFGESSEEEVEEDAAPSFDDINDELPYPRILNRVLPKDIRILAWCPNPPDGFSARFSCRERRYRYFFTQPAFAPLPGPGGLFPKRSGEPERDGWLNIDAMNDAARYYVGTHDFRNFCKLDTSKQITNFERDIRVAAVKACDPDDRIALSYLRGPATLPENLSGDHADPKVYYFEVHGNAFLWHQIRHMVAMLFLVGQGFESPTVVRDLLDITSNPRKPVYEMADDAPLVLWDCIFPDPEDGQGDPLRWIYPDGQIESKDRKQAFASSGDGRFGPAGINEVLWAGWREAKMDEILARQLLDVAASQRSSEDAAQAYGDPAQKSRLPQAARIFDGGDSARAKGTYVPVLSRERMDAVEVQNKRYLDRKSTPGASIDS